MSDDAIDLQEVMERVQDDRELLLELLQIFSEDFVEKKAALSQAITKQDFEQIRNISHSLKGASGNISAKKLHASFLNLEQMAKAKDVSQSAALLKQIDGQFADLQTYISDMKK